MAASIERSLTINVPALSSAAGRLTDLSIGQTRGPLRSAT